MGAARATRLGTVALVAATALLAGACGGSDKPAPAAKPMRLALEAPGDGARVTTDSVTVSGTVTPASAEVRVRGERATVSGGRFRATVSLDLGTNVIDVMASSEGTSPAFAALRITRQKTVRIPDLAGASPEEARVELEDLGLLVTIERKGGLVERVVPGERGVCETDPPSRRDRADRHHRHGSDREALLRLRRAARPRSAGSEPRRSGAPPRARCGP